jgi:hypothetical protein
MSKVNITYIHLAKSTIAHTISGIKTVCLIPKPPPISTSMDSKRKIYMHLLIFKNDVVKFMWLLQDNKGSLLRLNQCVHISGHKII